MESKITEKILDKTNELYIIRCPVCNKQLAALTDSHPDMTGWLKCANNHKTTYLHGEPLETTKNGAVVWKAS